MAKSSQFGHGSAPFEFKAIVAGHDYFKRTSVEVNPANAEELRSLTGAIENPDLSAVRGTPPHHWKLEQGGVVKKTPEEIEATEQSHAQVGVINHSVRRVEVPVRVGRMKRLAIGAALLAAGAAGHHIVSHISNPTHGGVSHEYHPKGR